MKSIWNISFIFGLACLVFGVSFLAHQFVRHRSCTGQAEGFITTLHRSGIPYPALAYTVDGAEYSRPFSGSDKISAGQTVTVMYNPSNPEQYYIAEDKSNHKILGIAFACGGVVFALIGYGVHRGLFG